MNYWRGNWGQVVLFSLSLFLFVVKGLDGWLSCKTVMSKAGRQTHCRSMMWLCIWLHSTVDNVTNTWADYTQEMVEYVILSIPNCYVNMFLLNFISIFYATFGFLYSGDLFWRILPIYRLVMSISFYVLRLPALWIVFICHFANFSIRTMNVFFLLQSTMFLKVI